MKTDDWYAIGVILSYFVMGIGVSVALKDPFHFWKTLLWPLALVVVTIDWTRGRK